MLCNGMCGRDAITWRTCTHLLPIHACACAMQHAYMPPPPSPLFCPACTRHARSHRSLPSNAQTPCQKVQQKYMCIVQIRFRFRSAGISSSFFLTPSLPFFPCNRRLLLLFYHAIFPANPRKSACAASCSVQIPTFLILRFLTVRSSSTSRANASYIYAPSSVQPSKKPACACIAKGVGGLSLPLSTPPPSARCRTASTSRQSRRPA